MANNSNKLRIEWLKRLQYNPIDILLNSESQEIVYFTKRDLLNMQVDPIESIWLLPAAKKIIRKQQGDGSWKYTGGSKEVRSSENYNQLETYRNLGFLIELFGFNRNHSSIEKAVEYLFGFQTPAGDFRGIYGNQYTPNYSAAILELMIKAGYEDDRRIKRCFDWLISIRQNDGGWAIPLRTLYKKLDVISMDNETLEPDRDKPSSHLITGIVLRAFAAHRSYREMPEIQTPSRFLLNQLFEADNYKADRSDPKYWFGFTFPFWFTDLISATDTLSLLGYKTNEPQIMKALQWFADNQGKDGSWKLHFLKNQRTTHPLWYSLAICRIFKRFSEN
jgi:hypothetical protein